MSSLTHLRALSLDHRQSTVQEREHALGLFNVLNTDQYLLQTCNRVEYYAWGDHPISVDLHQYGEHLSGRRAARHLFRVAAGLESMALGEAQILGQVKHAAEQKQSSPELELIVRSAIRCGKRVRTETDINKHHASIGSLSLNLAESKLHSLQHKHIAIIGMGQIGTVTVNACASRGLNNLTLLNRNLDRAQQLASLYGAASGGLDDLENMLVTADLIFCATSAPGYLLSPDKRAFADAIRRRQGRPLLLIDLAVPRDIDPAFETFEGVVRVDIDHLNADLDRAVEARRRAIPQVEAIIEEHLDRLEEALKGLAFRPVISDLRQQAETIRQAEVSRLLRFLGDSTDPETLNHIEKFSNALVNKLLHHPTRTLKASAHGENGEALANSVRELFNLHSDKLHSDQKGEA